MSIDSEKILCVPKVWENYVSCEFHEIHCELESLDWKKIIVNGENDPEVLDEISRAKVVIFWELYEFLERNEKYLPRNSSPIKITYKKIFFCDDVHHFTRYRQEQRIRAFTWADIIFATYPDCLRNWYPLIYKEKLFGCRILRPEFFIPEIRIDWIKYYYPDHVPGPTPSDSSATKNPFLHMRQNKSSRISRRYA